MENDMKNPSLETGYLLGGILALISVAIYSIDYKLLVDPSYSFLISMAIFIIIIGAGVYSTIQSKAINNNVLSFKASFKSYFTTVALGYFIYNITIYIIYSVVDPAAAKILDEEILIMAAEMMKGMQGSMELLEEASKSSNYSFSTIATSYVMKLTGYCLVGLLTSSIIKRE